MATYTDPSRRPTTGCATFDAALLQLTVDGPITTDEALRTADRPNDLRLRIHRALQGANETAPDEPAEHTLRLVSSEDGRVVPTTPE